MKSTLKGDSTIFWIKVTISLVFILGIFYFLFHTPKQVYTTSQDPSGNSIKLYSVEGVMSPYKNLLLTIHKYFNKNDSCFIDIGTGDFYCSPFVLKGNQLAITTDLSKFVLTVATSSNDIASSSNIIWKTFKNDELGISFFYPFVKNSGEEYWAVGQGDTGKAFQATIELPSGSAIYAYSTTKDYTAPKGGVVVSTEGFVIKNNEYYVISRGNPVSTTFIPDEVWKLHSGENVPVIYKKNYDPTLDYPDPEIKAMINIPSSVFTGVGFILWGKGPDSVSPDDIATFKKIVTSIEVIK